LSKRASILLPIHLDRWRNPIASKMREAAIRMPEFDFYSFSAPATAEDRRRSIALWEYENVHRIRACDLVFRSYDIVHHASATPANIAASLLARARGWGRTQHVFTASTPPNKDDRYNRAYRISIALADHVLAVSPHTAKSVERSMGRSVEAVIPNGVDMSFFSPAQANPIKHLGLPEGDFLLYVGAIVPWKHPERILELATCMPGISFIMLGRPAYSAWARELLCHIEQHPNIHYMDFREKGEIRDIMAQARLLLMPSEIEGMPNVVLEAAAMGLPVLALPIAAMEEIVEQEVSGWLIPLNSPDAWLAKIEEVLAWLPQQRIDFRRKARAWVKKHFTWESAAEKLAEFYSQILKSDLGG
jgi:glycosyltransferase involved in cell wall biosynthesis